MTQEQFQQEEQSHIILAQKHIKHTLWYRICVFIILAIITGMLGWIGSVMIPFTGSYVQNWKESRQDRDTIINQQRVTNKLLFTYMSADSVKDIKRNKRFQDLEDKQESVANTQVKMFETVTTMQSTITMLINGRVSNKNFLRDCDE